MSNSEPAAPATRWWPLAILFLLFVPAQSSAQDTLWRKYMEDGARAHQEGRYAGAEKSWLAAVKEAEEKFGPEDQRVVLSLNNLAGLYQAQGKYADAEPLYKRALAIREKALGREHPDVAKTLKNYAALLRKTGRCTEAAKLEIRAKEIRTMHKQLEVLR